MTRAAFITRNRWNGAIPCPRCLPGASSMTTERPANMVGVMRVIAEITATSKRLYVCFSCNHEEEK